MNRHAWWISIFVILSLALTPALAQSDTSQLSGTVRDTTGALVPGATVTVKNEDSGFQRQAITNDSGYYVVSNLPPGQYTVTVELSGFKRFVQLHKKVDPNIGARVDATLELGALAETISVISSSAEVSMETATLGKLIEGKQIELTELNGRNPLFLALTKAGVSSNSALGGFSFGLTSGGLNINGSRSQDNLVTFDGAVAIRTRSNGTSIGVADIEATQEVQVLTANYNAEFGRSAGGQVRIVTRSGSRDFHGVAYEYLRNSRLNANTWQRNANTPGDRPCEQFSKDPHCRPNPFRYNQPGYSLSGPVPLPFNKDRNKLFWLWGQEWVRLRQAANQSLVVPTLRMRNGDFSELLNPSNQFFGRAVVLNDPATGQPFPGNVIPEARRSPNGLALLKAFPEPIPGFVGPGGVNWFAERPATTDQRKDTVSIDFYPADKHQIRWRAQLYNFLDFTPFPFGSTTNIAGAEPGYAPRIFDRPNQTTTINWVWTISPMWVNEALVAGSRDQVFIRVDTSADRFKRSKYGINYPYIFPERKEIPDKIPTVDGLAPFSKIDGGPYPAQSTGPIYQFSDNMTHVRGNHTLKLGVYLERAGENDFDQINVAGTPGGTNNQNGRFAFTDATPGGTGRAIGNAAIGLFDTYAELGVRSFTPYRGHMFEWFAQDSWKATPKLRLEMGIRHSIIQPFYSLWGNMVVFDSGLYDPSIAVRQDPRTGFITSGDLKSRHNGLVIPGSGWPQAAKGRIPFADTGEFNFLFRGLPKQYSQIHKRSFQPRIGIAYAFNNKSVIRAGAGRFMTRLGVSDSVFLGGNPPLQPSTSVTTGSVDNPGGKAGNSFPLTITSQDRIFPNPEAWAWNVTVQREIGFNTTIEGSYVGRRGLHGQRERNINQLQPGQRLLPQNTGINVDTLRPYKGYSIIRVTNNDANSLYSGLQIEVNRRFAAGLGFGVAYTFSKLSDDGSAQRDVVPNAFDVHSLWGPADFDRRHVMAINAIYEIPIFRDHARLSGKLLGGWTITSVSQFQTGTPLSVTTGDDFSGVGPGSGSQYWVVNGDPKLKRGEQKFASTLTDQNYWFRASAPGSTCSTVGGAGCIFTIPPAGSFNSQRVRNSIYNPGFQNHNLALFKNFTITEKHKIQLRAEAFNWINHPNWNNSNTNPRNLATLGKVTSKGTGGERQLQFALRYSF